MLGDLGGAFSVPMVRIGDRLGLYRTLHESGPMTPAELARKAGIAERYAREWLSHQAASGYLDYDAAAGAFTLPPEQAMVFASPTAPSICRARSILQRSCWRTRRWSSRRSAPARASAGQSSRRACSAPSGASSVRAITPPRAVVAAGAGRHDGEAGARRDRGRCRLWARLLDRDHGQGVPALDLRRLRLPRRLDRAGAGACRAAWRDGQHAVRGRLRRRLPRRRTSIW